MQVLSLHTSNLRKNIANLSAGDKVLLSGTVYTARDAAHKKFFELLDQGQPLPINVQDAVIYYAGPTPSRPGQPIGSCGPTTSGRMDVYTPRLLNLGLAAMIGKGQRDASVCDSIRHNNAVYLCALGGAGALAAKCITACEVIAFPELGCESVKKLTLQDFPLIVGIDSHGGNLFAKS